MSLKSYLIERNIGDGNIGEFDELIFDSPNFSLPMFYKTVKLISYDPVHLTQTWLRINSTGILKYFRPVG